jgi:hypothetical protein
LQNAFSNKHPASREAVDVRRFHDLVAVAAEQRLQIIDADEQDVGFRCREERGAEAKRKKAARIMGRVKESRRWRVVLTHVS